MYANIRELIFEESFKRGISMKIRLFILAVVFAILIAAGSVQAAALKAGQTVLFGNYEQDNNTRNGKEPIEWLVLKVNYNEALLISKYLLDTQPIWENAAGPGLGAPNWDNSRLRLWLNGSFLYDAFSSSERNMIRNTRNENPTYGFEGASDPYTYDRIFIFTPKEAEKYLSGSARMAKPTAYCAAKGAKRNSSGYSTWWLRPESMRAVGMEGTLEWAFVKTGGSIGLFYIDSEYTYDPSSTSSWEKFRNTEVAVRPALWINFEP